MDIGSSRKEVDGSSSLLQDLEPPAGVHDAGAATSQKDPVLDDDGGGCCKIEEESPLGDYGL